jgi:signal peptidase I
MSAARTCSFVRTTLVWVVIGFALTALLAAAAPIAIGDRSFVVRSGSMSPALDTGDVVAAKQISPLEAEPGDIVTFMDPDGSGRRLSHRAVSVERKGGRVSFVTQGDANTSQERWTIPASARMGVVEYRVPKLGFAASWISKPIGRIGLLILPALLLAASLLAGIWRGGSERERIDELV